MRDYSESVLDFRTETLGSLLPSCVGHLVSIDAGGRAEVDFPDNPGGPCAARALAGVASGQQALVRPGGAVLLAFDQGDRTRPIIVGFVQECLLSPVKLASNLDAKMDGRKVMLTAREEILIETGKGSIHLRKDGKIVLKGTSIVSRASRANKIRGGTVSIN